MNNITFLIKDAATTAFVILAPQDLRVCYIGAGLGLMGTGLSLMGRGAYQVIKGINQERKPQDLNGSRAKPIPPSKNLGWGVATFGCGLTFVTLGALGFYAAENNPDEIPSQRVAHETVKDPVHKALSPTDKPLSLLAQKMLSQVSTTGYKCFSPQSDLSRKDIVCATKELLEGGKISYWGHGRLCLMLFAKNNTLEKELVSAVYNKTYLQSWSLKHGYHC